MSRSRHSAFVLLVVPVALSVPMPAYAYVGPASFISGFGALLAAVAAVGAALFGFLWFPLKRVYRRTRAPDGQGEAATPDARP